MNLMIKRIYFEKLSLLLKNISCCSPYFFSNSGYFSKFVFLSLFPEKFSNRIESNLIVIRNFKTNSDDDDEMILFIDSFLNPFHSFKIMKLKLEYSGCAITIIKFSFLWFE
ncbi:hypothetical protein DERF_013316 [Dermatophagoides farinae]|uniref:Uncharacterized protein n=1 Tax=Dermatophagoides farinae TaxID=6954 RepID=A0A922HPX2_DERFA|nr:hypothetical protein DERF_013316 [Dermatophagoides farinae]